MTWMTYRRKLRCESDLQYDLCFAGKPRHSGRKTIIQPPAAPISPRLLSKFLRAYMRAGTVFESSLEQGQLILSWQQIQPLFARDGMAGFRPRSEFQCIDSDPNVEHQRCWWSGRPHLFDARQRLGCDWRGRECALLRPQLLPDRIGRFTDSSFGDEFPRHRGEHIVPSSSVCSPSPENFPSIASDTSNFFPMSRRQADCMVSPEYLDPS